MQTNIIGKSVLGSPIFSHSKGEGKKILILGGVHGDEIEGVAFVQNLLTEVWDQGIKGLNLHIISQLNPDGVLLKQRHNFSGVDLNRNLPTKDWDAKAFSERYFPGVEPNSEPENQVLVEYIKSHNFQFIFSFHSFTKFLLNTNGNCEPFASLLNSKTGYPIEESMGYPTPGCLGTYTGIERGIPTITYELEKGKNILELINLHKPAVIACLQKMAEEL